MDAKSTPQGGIIASEFTALNQNWSRDYDSTLGRYVQSDLIGLLGGWNTYQYADSNPFLESDFLGLVVLLCHRAADLPFPMNQFDHYWIKTGKYESGMGPMNGQVPAQQGRSDWPYDPTQTVNHAGQSKEPNATCEVQRNVNESCVNSKIKPGQPLGHWTPFNQCQSFAYGTVNACRFGPQLPELKKSRNYCMRFRRTVRLTGITCSILASAYCPLAAIQSADYSVAAIGDAANVYRIKAEMLFVAALVLLIAAALFFVIFRPLVVNDRKLSGD